MKQLKRVWRRVRRQGIGSFIRNDLRRWLFSVEADACIVFRVSASGRVVPPIPEGYTLVEVSSTSDPAYPVSELAQFHAKDQLNAGRPQETIRNDLLADLRNGDSCWMLVDRESREIAAWRWVGGQNTRHLREMAKPVGLQSDEAITYRAYVDHGHRGARLQNVLQGVVLEDLRKRGINQAFSYTGIANTASLINQFRYSDYCMPMTRVRIQFLGRDISLFPGFDASNWTECGARRTTSSTR